MRLPVLFLTLALGIAMRAGWAVDAPATSAAAVKVATETKAQHDVRMAWWRDAKFGLFIHWGLYSEAAGYWNGQTAPAGRDGRGEWIMDAMKIPVADYAKLANTFDPEKFNAGQWVAMAKDAGVKYIVITAKHHEGFAMFHAADPFNIYDATPFKRDPMKELSEACRKQGMRLGFYYSQAQDWHHPGGAEQNPKWDPATQGGDMDAYLKNICIPQLTQLLTDYGPVAELWYDTPAGMTRERADQIAPLVARLQPDMVTNNRLGGGYQGDLSTPEGHIPATGYPNRDWESCIPMAGTWGYKKDIKNYTPSATLIGFLIDVASKGGNLLLNISPMGDGAVPGQQIQRLHDIGAWLKVNGEAIYGTKPSIFGGEAGSYDPTQTDQDGNALFKQTWDWRCTTTDDKIFIHLFKWPAGAFTLAEVPNKVTRTYLLADPARTPLTFRQEGKSVTVNLPDQAPDPVVSVLALEVQGPLIRPGVDPLAQGADGSISLAAPFAEILNGGDAVATLKCDGTTLTNWTRPGDFAQWTATLKTAGRFHIFIAYALAPSVGAVTCKVAAEKQSLAGTLPPTTGWGRFQGFDLGIMEIPQAGSVLISLKPGDPKKSFANVRSLLLVPDRQKTHP